MKTFSFQIDPASDVPPWVQLRQRLVYLIDTGYYRPGEQLPTVRGLAAEISMNYNTVNKAYLSLASDGYIESTRGRGAFVRDLDREVGSEHAQEIDDLIDDLIDACLDLGLSYDDIQARMARRLKRRKRAAGMPDPEEDAGRIVEFMPRAASSSRSTSGA